MKLSLLELTQNILSALNSQQVNSISDTPESVQVAEAIKTTYMNMLGRYDLPEHNQLFQLTSTVSSTPTLMLRPPGTTRIEWIKYFDSNPADGTAFQQDQFGAYSHDLNTDLQNNASGVGWSTTSVTSNAIGTGSFTFTVVSGLSIHSGDTATAFSGTGANSMSGTVTSYTGTTLVLNIISSTGAGTFNAWTIVNASTATAGPGYKSVHMMPTEEFMYMMATFDPTESDVGSFQLAIPNNDTGLTQNFTIYFKNDKQPQYCCIIGNTYIVFDSYDNTQDTILQSSKNMCFGWVYPGWTMSDTFVPNIDDQQVPLLMASAKRLAFYELKQMDHVVAKEEEGWQVTSLQKWKAIANNPTYFDQLADFGRRGNYRTGGIRGRGNNEWLA